MRSVDAGHLFRRNNIKPVCAGGMSREQAARPISAPYKSQIELRAAYMPDAAWACEPIRWLLLIGFGCKAPELSWLAALSVSNFLQR